PLLLDAKRTKFVLPVRDAFPREKIAAPCPIGFGEPRLLQIEPAMKRPIASITAAITSINETRVLRSIVYRLLCEMEIFHSSPRARPASPVNQSIVRRVADMVPVTCWLGSGCPEGSTISAT